MTWLPDLPKRLGLLGKTLIALLAVGLVPVLLLSAQLIGLNRDAMREQVLRTHAVAARTAAERIDSFLEVRKALARSVASSPLFAGDPHSSAATALLSDLLSPELGVVSASVRNPAGEEVVRAQRSELALAMEAVLSQLAMPGPGEESLQVVSAEASLWMAFATPLMGDQGSLVMICDLAPAQRALRPEEMGEEADLVLSWRDGSPVVGSSDALSTFPTEMKRSALTGMVSGAGRYRDPGDDAILGAFAPVTEADWVVLSRQPARIAEATAGRMFRRSSLALLLGVLLTFGLAAAAHRSLVRPIRDLIDAQRRLAGLEHSPLAGGGEIEQLKASFEILERRIREKEELGQIFLGRYQVQEILGEGAMGTVFRGWDPALERPLALKTVRLGETVDEERSELAGRLLREAVTVARFSHPNIVAVHDLQESPEVAFLAMELVDGVSLDEYLSAKAPLPPSQVVPLGLAIARGLAAAHARDVVHQDIKPANVLLGLDGAIKVADFGISQFVSCATTPDGGICGTPGYLPPESLRGEGYGPQGDLFALGVVLYQALTGKRPFTGKNLNELMVNTLTADVAPVASLEPLVPEALARLVMDLLERDTSQRCGTAEEVLARLESLAGEMETGWEPPQARGEGDTQEMVLSQRSRQVVRTVMLDDSQEG